MAQVLKWHYAINAEGRMTSEEAAQRHHATQGAQRYAETGTTTSSPKRQSDIMNAEGATRPRSSQHCNGWPCLNAGRAEPRAPYSGWHTRMQI